MNTELSNSLGKPADELGFLAALDDQAQQRLLDDIQHARQEHRDNIKQSLEDALNHVPRLLRGPLRKIFGA